MHEGLDFAAPKGTPIHAASGGVVTEARYVSGYGKLVEVSHGNGLITRYAHASSINVKVGDLVEKRSEEHTSELQSLMRSSYAVFCWKKKNNDKPAQHIHINHS